MSLLLDHLALKKFLGKLVFFRTEVLAFLTEPIMSFYSRKWYYSILLRAKENKPMTKFIVKLVEHLESTKAENKSSYSSILYSFSSEIH